MKIVQSLAGVLHTNQETRNLVAVQGFGRPVVLEETQYEGILGKPRGLIRKRLQSAEIYTTLTHVLTQMNFPVRSDE